MCIIVARSVRNPFIVFPRPSVLIVLGYEAFSLSYVVVVVREASVADLSSTKVGFGAVGGSGVVVGCRRCLGLVLVAVVVANSWGLWMHGIGGIS